MCEDAMYNIFGMKQKQDQYQSENYGSADKVIPLLC